jgi:hypothetical protein
MIQPTKPLVRPLPVDLLLNNGARFGAFGNGSEAGVYIRENDYGVAIFTPAGTPGNIDSLTQYFRNGEIWGINADVLLQGERAGEKWLISHGVEQNTAESLNLYIELFREVSKIEPPYTVEADIEAVAAVIWDNEGLTECPTLPLPDGPFRTIYWLLSLLSTLRRSGCTSASQSKSSNLKRLCRPTRKLVADLCLRPKRAFSTSKI